MCDIYRDSNYINYTKLHFTGVKLLILSEM